MKLLILVLATVAFSATDHDLRTAEVAWVASGEICEPETVLALPDNSLLVSNVCDFRKKENGYLTLLNEKGEALDWQIVDGLDSPLGMVLVDDMLYIVDDNRVKVFQWPGYKHLKTIDLNTAVANDIAVARDGTLYVTDSGKHQVIKRLPSGEQAVLIGEKLFKNANGIALLDNHLYVGGERLWCINLSDNTIKTIGPEQFADIDGIEFEADGTLQLTPVGGPLIRYRHDGSIEVYSGEGISSANHGFAANLNLALIPTGFDNSVIAIRIKAD